MFGIVSDKPSRISEQFYNVKHLHGSKKLQMPVIEIQHNLQQYQNTSL
jgi:hypothetical protein